LLSSVLETGQISIDKQKSKQNATWKRGHSITSVYRALGRASSTV